MQVFRVENLDGCGPYSGFNGIAAKLANTHKDMSTHPAPGSDGIERFDGWYYYKCGFLHLESLFVWFDGFCNELKLNNYFISEYLVKDKFVVLGRRQLMFYYDRAILAERIEF